MKKIIAIAMIVVLAVSAVVGGTFAYFTDRDAQKNTFTVGNVEIDLWEDFGDNDGIEDLIPSPGKDEDGNVINAVEKEVYVTNTGSEDIYTRVHIAIPAVLDNPNDAGKNILHFNYNKENVGEGKWDWSKTSGEAYTGDWNMYTMTIKENVNGMETDVVYNVYVVTYEKALAPEETTVDAISQVYMDKDTTQEQIAEIKAALGEEWHIYVGAEAGQAAGFDDAYTALNEQFDVPGEYWFDWAAVTGKGATFVDTETITESVSESVSESLEG